MKRIVFFSILGLLLSSCQSSQTVHVHTWGDPVIENETKGTCTEEGYYDVVVYCPDDHVELDRKRYVTEPLGHDYVAKEEYENGDIYYECTRCKDGFVEKTKHHFSELWSYDAIYHWHASTDKGYEHLKGDKAEHFMSEEITLPTENEYGYITHKCVFCDFEYKDSFINPTSATTDYGFIVPSMIKGGFSLGDFYNGNILESDYRMVSNEYLNLDYSATLVSDWNQYFVYVYYLENDTWHNDGWVFKSYSLKANTKYRLVVGRKSFGTTPLSEEEQESITKTVLVIPSGWNNEQRQKISIPKLMNRQGEGYGYPDNSVEGLRMAAKDGYSKIRISIAATKDNKLYCVHDYELEHNSELHYASIDGEPVEDDILINECNSFYIEQISYKGYDIPTLEEAMEELSKYDVEITWELKYEFKDQDLSYLTNLFNCYSSKIIISSKPEIASRLIQIKEDLRLAIVFHYEDTLAIQYKNEFLPHCESLRFDCYYGDEVSVASIAEHIHPDIQFKFGGGTQPKFEEIIKTMQFADICEVNWQLTGLLFKF